MDTELSRYHSFESYRYNQHTSVNQYRTAEFSQPRALRDDDKLSNSWVVSGKPYEDHTDGLSLLFRGRPKRYVPVRLPLQLLGAKRGVLPQDLQAGDVLQTGCTVLEPPVQTGSSNRPTDQRDVIVSLSGGQRIQTVAAPDDLELAVYGTVDDLGAADDPFTQLAVEKLRHLRVRALRSLADHALFEAMLARY